MNKLQELEQQLQEQQAKLNDLQSEIEKLKQTKHIGNQWIPKFEDKYYMIGDAGIIWCKSWVGNKFDYGRLSIRNVFKTEEEAEFEVERRKVIAELKKYAKEFVVEGQNWHFYFNYDERMIIYGWYEVCKTPSLYFPSEEIARKAV